MTLWYSGAFNKRAFLKEATKHIEPINLVFSRTDHHRTWGHDPMPWQPFDDLCWDLNRALKHLNACLRIMEVIDVYIEIPKVSGFAIFRMDEAAPSLYELGSDEAAAPVYTKVDHIFEDEVIEIPPGMLSLVTA